MTLKPHLNVAVFNTIPSLKYELAYFHAAKFPCPHLDHFFDNFLAMASRATKKLRKSPEPPKPKVSTFFKAAIPEHVGEWAGKCIQRWSLIPPFDPSVSEAGWRAYYEERATLDWWIKANGCIGCSEDSDEDEDDFDYKTATKDNGEPLPLWEENFPRPRLESYVFPPELEEDFKPGDRGYPNKTVEEHMSVLQEVVNAMFDECINLKPFSPGIVQGLYVLGGDTEWYDMESFKPEEGEFDVRLYSPCALGTSINLRSKISSRSGRMTAYYTNEVRYELRGTQDCSAVDPLRVSFGEDQDRGSILYYVKLDRESNRRRLARRLIKDSELKDISRLFFGYENLISHRKFFTLLAYTAAYSSPFTDKADRGVMRESRRRWKLFPGEVEKEREGKFEIYDYIEDSGDEKKLEEIRKRKKDLYRLEMSLGPPMHTSDSDITEFSEKEGGYGGGESDDDDDDDDDDDYDGSYW